MKTYLLPLLVITLAASGCLRTQAPKVLSDDPLAVQEHVSPAAPTAPAVQSPVAAQTAAAVSQPTVPADTRPVADTPKAAAPVKPATTATAPVPDTAVFSDEPLMPLEGRTLSPLALLAPQPDTVSSPWQGEQLKYGLYYSFVKVGTAFIKNRGLVDIAGRQAYLIQTTAFSASVIDTVFKVRDINLSWLDTQHFYSLGYSQSLREGNYRRDEWVNFDYTRNTYSGQLAKKSGTRAISGTLSRPVLDMLTSLYFVRGQNLKNGQDVVFDILNREEQYPLVVKVIGRETVKTPAGKFKCVIVEPQFRGEGIFVSKGKSLKVWLTDDERKMPVKMKVEVFIGSVSAELLEYKRN